MGTGLKGTQGEVWIPKGLTSERLITLVITQQVHGPAVRRGRKGGNSEEIEEKWRARSASFLKKKKLKLKL